MEFDPINEVPFEAKLYVCDQEIDDILDTACYGINYWCSKIVPVSPDGEEGLYMKNWATENVALGGSLLLYDSEEDRVYVLDKIGFLRGLGKYVVDSMCGKFNEFCTVKFESDHQGRLRLDMGSIDASIADLIVQYAVLGKVVYG